MVLNIAKSNQPIMLVSIPLIILTCWVNPIVESNIVFHPGQAMPLFALLLKVFPPAGLLNSIAGYLLITIIALLLTRLNTKFIFIPERTYLPSVVYLVIVFSIFHINYLHPIVVAVVLILVAFERMLESYKNESLSYNSFDASLLIGIASLFYFQAIFVLIFVWTILSVLRPFYWREWMFTFIGAGLPYFFFFCIAYLINYNLSDYYANVEAIFFSGFQTKLGLKEYVFLSFLFVIVIISSQYIIKTMGSIKILARKSFNLLLMLFLISLSMYFSIVSITEEIIILTGVPLSMVISNYFIVSRRSRWKEVLFDLLIVLFILSQLLNLEK